ncbi:hypothetical protein HZB88_01125 [archaeon]|nr:hypothetical protein [archaeon]
MILNGNMGINGKKGQAEVLQLMLLFEVLIGIVIAGTFIYFSLHPDEFSGTGRMMAEKELNYIVDAMQVAPDNVKVVYPVDYKYSVDIDEENKVIVKKTGSYKLGKYNLIIEKQKDGGITIHPEYG